MWVARVEMWVGRVASPPPPTAATPTNAFRAAHKRVTSSARARSTPASPSSASIHTTSSSTSCNGGALGPVSPLCPGGRWRRSSPVAFASSRPRRGKPASPGFVAMEDSDEEFDEWEDEDEDGEGEGDEPTMPLDEMRRWLRNQPAGFGKARSYDTTIEDRLLEEMEQSKQAQLANINKLKSGASPATSKTQHQRRIPAVDGAEVAPNSARVRVRGLPRKRNIDRDLKLAFKRLPSIVNISPAVGGNKKTRDPVCKGFAFIDFKSDEAANKFVQTYSKQSVLFGRVQKVITCDIVNTSHSSNPGSEKLNQHRMFTQQRLIYLEGEARTEPNLNASTQDLEDQDSTVLNDFGIGHDIEENHKRITTEEDQSSLIVDTAIDIGYSQESFLVSEESVGLRNVEGAAESRSSKQKQKAHRVSRKKSVKTKPDKAPKLSMPGSVARLKVKERAVLTGVLSKYGERATPASSEKS